MKPWIKGLLIKTLGLNSLVVSAKERSNGFEFCLPWNDSTKTVTYMSATLDGHFWFGNKTVFKN